MEVFTDGLRADRFLSVLEPEANVVQVGPAGTQRIPSHPSCRRHATRTGGEPRQPVGHRCSPAQPRTAV